MDGFVSMVAQTCALEHQSILKQLKHFTLCFMSLDMVVVCCNCGSSGCEKVVRTHFFFGPDMSSGPSVELIMWKWRQEVLQVQAETEAHMVEIAPLALATWTAWFSLGTVPLAHW